MPLPPKPSFGETPNKTHIFVVEFREKSAFREIQNRFRRVEVRLRQPFPRPEKGNG